MKKLAKTLLILLGALALLLAAAAGLSRLVYGRSLRATVYEAILRRRYANPRTVEAEAERLNAKYEAGEKPYALPSSLRLRADVAESDFNGMQVFTLNGGGGAATVFYLHGGAYINPFNAYQWRFMDRLARKTGCEIVAPAYHLAPYADYARAYEDLSGLYRAYAAAHPGRRTVLMGDSAGGGLALGLAEYLAQAGDALPERLILFSPWVDISMDNPDIEEYVPLDPILHLHLVKLHGEYWAGRGDVHDWMASPLFGPMEGLPPVTVYAGTRELLYPDLLLLEEALRGAGVDVVLRVGAGMNHDYPLMPLPEANRAFREVVRLIDTTEDVTP